MLFILLLFVCYHKFNNNIAKFMIVKDSSAKYRRYIITKYRRDIEYYYKSRGKDIKFLQTLNK